MTKLSPNGSALVYSTYLGGAGDDFGMAIGLDWSGSAYVTGYTSSANFPKSPSAYQKNLQGPQDAFVTKLNAGGSQLIYSTFLGGNGNDFGNGIAFDVSGNVYVTGETDSTNFPLQNPIQAALGGGVDAFVTKLNAAGSALVYSTYLGGNGVDSGMAIALDGTANAHVTGITTSTNFPLAKALSATYGGNYDAFVTEVNAAGSALVYSTYLGGSTHDEGWGIAVDAAGVAYCGSHRR